MSLPLHAPTTSAENDAPHAAGVDDPSRPDACPGGHEGVPDRRGRRTAIAVLVAVSVHVGLALTLRAVDVPRAAEGGPHDEVAIEMVELPALDDRALAPSAPAEPSVAGTTSGTFGSVTGGRSEASAARVPNSASIAPATGQSPETAPPSNSSGPTPSTSSEAAMIVMVTPGALGIAGAGGGNPLLAGRGEVPTVGSGSVVRAGADRGDVPSNDKAAEKAVRDALRAEDATRGLGPEGPVVNALRDATYASAAPVHGTATFVAVVDASGLVVDLKLLAATGGTGWDDAHARAKRALAGAKLALRGARGAEIAILVESDVKRPSGTRANEGAVRQAVRPGTVTMSESSSGGTWATQVAADGDVSDLANAKRRVVSLRVVSRKSL